MLLRLGLGLMRMVRVRCGYGDERIWDVWLEEGDEDDKRGCVAGSGCYDFHHHFLRTR